MCGISGIITTTQLGIDVSVLQKAAVTMKHRGPDASHTWISSQGNIGLGHVRLSIVDLDHRSDQPFIIDDGEYVMTFNGEIYNYTSLRQLLEKEHHVQFATTSDTEVLLYLYKFFGTACLQLIQGMFAFCIYDKKTDHCFLARDFVGQKPLVYAQYEDAFYFASEIPALFSLCPNLPKTIDLAVLQLYCIDNFFHIPGSLSIFTTVHKLSPGTYMIVKDGHIIEEKRYATLIKKGSHSAGQEVDFLYAKLEEMKPKDIDYASFLSGGIDSSFVCSALKRNADTRTDAYTLKVGPHDKDFERAQYVTEVLDLDHHVVTMDSFDMLASINASIKILGEPYFHITSLFADNILQHAKQKHRVMFTGAGGDECYYGYNNSLFLCMDFYFSIKKWLPLWVIKALDWCTKRKYTSILHATKETCKRDYLASNRYKTSPLFKDASTPEVINKIQQLTDAFQQSVLSTTYIDYSYMFGLFVENMHSLVIQGDLIGMKNSMEIRSVFLERDVIERAYSLGLRNKISWKRLHEGKEVLRKQLGKVFGKKFLYAKKIGFGVEYDFKQHFANTYQALIYQKIDALLARSIFEKEQIDHVRQDFKKHFCIIMKLYSLEIWFETFID